MAQTRIVAQPYNIPIVVYTDKRSFIKDGWEKYKLDFEEVVENCDGYTVYCPYGEKSVLIFLQRKWDEETVWHESLHATHFVCEHFDLGISMETTETQAFLQGYIATTIKKELYKRKKVVKDDGTSNRLRDQEENRIRRAVSHTVAGNDEEAPKGSRK